MRSRPSLAAATMLVLVGTACQAASTSPSPSATAAPVTDAPSASEAPSDAASASASADASEGASGTELNYALQPNFGTTDLESGFTPDPFSVEVTSGGPIDASYLGGGCAGFATEAPDYDVIYTSGSLSLLRFYFVPEEGSGDTTLIVNTPDVSWACGDDSYGGLNPTVDFEDPHDGLYDIWIGSYDPAEQISGTLYVTEGDANHP